MPRNFRILFLKPSTWLAGLALLTLVALAACGGDDGATQPPAADTPVPPATQAPAADPTDSPKPTDEPAPSDTPEPAPTTTEQPTPEPPATVAFATPMATQAPQATQAPATPEATAAPPTPEPTMAPATPEATAAPATPQPTAAPSEPVTPCEGDRGGEVGNCAPEFQGTQEWINSEPLTMESLRGKVVLIDFWTYSCINCIRTIPFLQTWHERYADEGLVIVGVHTPEFEFERVYDNVVEATIDMGVAWPVVQDNEYQVWSEYSNRFWPAKYLIDKNGVIQFRHFGEGKYAETEEEIRRLLEELGAESESLAMPLPEDRQQRDDTFLEEGGRQTPELFAGWRFSTVQGRGGIAQLETYAPAAQESYVAGNQEGVVAEFELPDGFLPDLIYFQGLWSIGPESAVHARETEGYLDFIVLHYAARSVNAVLTSESGEPYKVVVTVNNMFLTDENKGDDVIIDENGESYLMVTSPKAYKIVEHPEWQERQILALSSLSDDFGLFSFTFGTYEDGF